LAKIVAGAPIGRLLEQPIESRLFSRLEFPALRPGDGLFLASTGSFGLSLALLFLGDPVVSLPSRHLNKSGHELVEAVFQLLLFGVSPRLAATISPVPVCLRDV
jgi:hypothetical protein